jgi:hypothetical protein
MKCPQFGHCGADQRSGPINIKPAALDTVWHFSRFAVGFGWEKFCNCR